ncbi:hypothetical protein [Spirochaeta africana]|nr:hypothetical protein [Spirochaeta africana]
MSIAIELPDHPNAAIKNLQQAFAGKRVTTMSNTLIRTRGIGRPT